MPVHTKTISCQVRKVLSFAKGHMFPGTLCGAMASAALVAAVSLVFILQAGDMATVSNPARHHFQHISLPQTGSKIQFSILL